MSAVAIILLVIPIMIVMCLLIYLINKLLPFGLIGSFSSDEDVQIVVTGDKNDKDAQAYKLNQNEDSPTDWTLIAVAPDSDEDSEDEDSEDEDSEDEEDEEDDGAAAEEDDATRRLAEADEAPRAEADDGAAADTPENLEPVVGG